MMKSTLIRTDIDFERPGKQLGKLQIPYSYNLGGWAKIHVPVACLARGDGLTVLLMAGNHGDEYPGQIAIMKLMRGLDLDRITGRLIMIPALNVPAARTATRLSPIDGTNLNRCFPGDPHGNLSQMLADYLTTVLFPLADAVIDLHTGGRGVYFYPCAHMHLVDDLQQRRKMARAALAYQTDLAFLYADVAGRGLLPVEAERQGKVVVTTEMGGGEVVPADVHRLSQDGLINVLIHLGVVEGREKTRADRGLPPTRWVQSLDESDYQFAEESGLYESLVDVGAPVEAGQTLGLIHFLECPNREPVTVKANTAGILIAHRGPTATAQGDLVTCLAHDVDAKTLATFKT
jgi:N-alpha-acetyl-L-2,4-diaminobutyrate deacetylase